MTRAGAGMAADIDEQPAGYARLLSTANAAEIARVAAIIAERRPRHVVFTARGTSDHAALYGAYLTEIRLGLPAGLASPSAVTLFGPAPTCPTRWSSGSARAAVRPTSPRCCAPPAPPGH